VVVFDRYEGMKRPSFGDIPPRGIWTAAMKRNVADGRVALPEEDTNPATSLWLPATAAQEIGKD